MTKDEFIRNNVHSGLYNTGPGSRYASMVYDLAHLGLCTLEYTMYEDTEDFDIKDTVRIYAGFDP